MAYQRTRNDGSLQASIESVITNYKTQLSVRNAEEESKFTRLVLDTNMSLEGQLSYRKEQLKRMSDDPAESIRIRESISTLKDQIEQKEYEDSYLDELTSFESGKGSVDRMLNWLNTRLAGTTDSSIKTKIRNSIKDYEGKKFDLSQQALDAQTSYALQDKSLDILDKQIKKVSEAAGKARLSGDTYLQEMYELDLQRLNKAKSETEISRTSMDFATRMISGYRSPTEVLDEYNLKMRSASTGTPIDIGGQRYDSARDFWTFRRDSYLADSSENGFFPSMGEQSKTMLATKYSNNALTATDIFKMSHQFDELAGRPELQAYAFRINSTKQDIIQTGADYAARSIALRYERDLDLNRAFADMDVLEKAGANVSSIRTQIMAKAANIKETQVGNILATAEQLMEQGLAPQEAIDKAIAQGAGAVLSPEQAVSKTEEEIATEFREGAEGEKFGTEPRTTVGTEVSRAVPEQPVPPTVAPKEVNLADKYGIVGRTVYRKSDNSAFTSEKEFFDETGLTSFQNVKFDTAYSPPQADTVEPPKSPIEQEQETVTYKVQKGDTLSKIAGQFLGDPSLYRDIARQNNIADPNRIMEGQELNIRKRK